jgi:hypothetical protein
MARGACPAVKTLDSVLRSKFPLLNGSFKDVNGKLSQRLQTGGNPRHQMGVCLDILLFSMEWKIDPSVDWKSEKALAENLVRAFIDVKDDMKWTEIILQDRFFWEPEYYRAYGKDRAHFTHIHIDWMTNSLKGKGKSEAEIIKSSPHADHTGFMAPLIAKLDPIRADFESGSLTGVNLSTIAKTFRPEVNPVGEWRVVVGEWTWIYSFDGAGNVSWRDPYGQGGKGTWQVGSDAIRFSWFNSTTTETWQVPITPSAQKGVTTIKGKTYAVEAVRL